MTIDKYHDARRLFIRDNAAIAQRDRRTYKTFDAMPEGLMNWWRDRAERYADHGMYRLRVKGSAYQQSTGPKEG